MPPTQEPVDTFAALPDPGQAASIDGLVERLRLLKVWAGDPSYERIRDRVNEAWTAAGRPAGDVAGKTTVVECFRTGRRRLNPELVVAVVQALHSDVGYVAQWRQALRVIGGQSEAAAQVRVQDSLPRDLVGFTGRTAELDQLLRALRNGQQDGGAVVISAIAGMAGVGKTQLAIHAGHLLNQEKRFERVLFVNLRGFHPDPAQPPADPAAVLDGFLRLLGVPGQQIPHGLEARAAAYRRRLAGTRTLVVLDNAADEEQVRPLLPETPGCFVLVTSRRDLTDLRPATQLAVDVFTPDEALAFLTGAAPLVPVGEHPNAPARIARRCGYLPLALGLVAAHIRGTPGWTLSDHADRLDERHRDRLLDTGVELALDLSYQHLPTNLRRLLRLAALHPGQDFDAHAAAALADTDLPAAQATLRELCRDHLLQQAAPGRYTFHDLVRAYAAGRASDQDSPPQRRAALTRLFDYYLATTAAAMNTLYPAEVHRQRPRIPPAKTPTPVLAEPDAARAWLDTERPTLVAVVAHTAAQGWPTYTTRLSSTLFRYLAGGHHTDALTIYRQAHRAARHNGVPTEQADALNGLGTAYLRLGRYGQAAEHFRRALTLFRRAGDPAGHARTLTSLGVVEERLGRYQPAAGHLHHALHLLRQTSDRTGEARTLACLGIVEGRLGRFEAAADHHEQALTVCRHAGDRHGEASALNKLGHTEVRLGRHGLAADHLHQALTLCRQLGNRSGEARTLDSLGALHADLGQPAAATEHYQQALAIFHEISHRVGEAWALNGLGDAAHAAGRPTDALTHHTAAHTIAIDTSDRDQQARAHTGLGHAHRVIGDVDLARQHYQHALTLYTELGMPDADQLRAHLATIDNTSHQQHQPAPTVAFTEGTFREGNRSVDRMTTQAAASTTRPDRRRLPSRKDEPPPNSEPSAADSIKHWAGRYLDTAVHGVRPAEANKIALHLARFRDHFHTTNGHERLSAVVRRDVVTWREHLTADSDRGGRGFASATVNAHLAALSGFASWVVAHEPAALPHGNPCAKVSDLPLPALKPRALSPGQVRTLKDLLDRLPRFHQHKGRRRAGAGALHGHARPLRDRAIIHVLLSTGLRREELVDLNLDQLTPGTPVDLRATKKAEISGVRGKGRTSRHILLSADARAAVADYLQHERPTDVSATSSALFMSAASIRSRRPDGRLSPRSINTICHQIGRWHDAEHPDPARHISPLRPHDLRHSFGLALAAATGNNTDELQRRLGHQSQRYLSRYTNPPEDIAAGDVKRL